MIAPGPSFNASGIKINRRVRTRNRTHGITKLERRKNNNGALKRIQLINKMAASTHELLRPFAGTFD